MSYYDIDDILADSMKLPCKFTITIPGLGYLNGQPSEPIKKNIKLELPIWLAEILAVCSISPDNFSQSQTQSNNTQGEEDEQTFLRLIEPEFFSSQFLNFIKSSSLKLNLTPYAYYYKLTTKWSYMFNDTELVNLISTMLIERCCELNDLSYKLNDQFSAANLEFLSNLESWEKDVFKVSHASYKEFKNWWLATPSN